MTKTWVLDSETKGTGAHIAPLASPPAPGKGKRELALVEFDRPARPPKAAEPRESPRFKIVDVLSSQVLADGVDTRAAIRVLEGMRSVLDARIFRWAPKQRRWRLLTLAESKRLWAFRGSLDASGAPQRQAEPQLSSS
jgi:hypothetical protein